MPSGAETIRQTRFVPLATAFAENGGHPSPTPAASREEPVRHRRFTVPEPSVGSKIVARENDAAAKQWLRTARTLDLGELTVRAADDVFARQALAERFEAMRTPTTESPTAATTTPKRRRVKEFFNNLREGIKNNFDKPKIPGRRGIHVAPRRLKAA